MRFLENGPSIPDDLLIARDEGRVVFFCGAGVSRARAGLSDFFGLADDVIRRLGATTGSSACKILCEARAIEKRTGVNGLISADRIFGLLEREFLLRDIEFAVAKALQPPTDVDLSAHRILLELATTSEGKVRLVTTNFDRLFDDCNSALQVWQPPRLPDPARQNEMDGIIHLHGRTNKDYSGSEGDGFILSSSEFGRAYLAEGWATKFFKEIIDRYIVVFVGYTADDPPVQYLLEALKKKAGQLSGVYAFQAGTMDEAIANWRHKGIEAIAYAEEDGHQALWETLDAWAARAKAPDEWHQLVIDLAKKGPENLQPHERGQVAHIVSTLEGARKFSASDDPPPAEWLCVFDPVRRYAKPGHSGRFGAHGQYIDPFDRYGLDSDVAPNKINPDDHYATREVPENTWDGLATSRLDRQNLHDDNYSAIRGHWATNIPKCPLRLLHISMWISKVANQPAAVWWAASQTGLHPNIQKMIKWELLQPKKIIPPEIRRAWGYLFEAWVEKRGDFDGDWYDLKAVIDKDGWDSTVVRKYATINRPYLKVGRNYIGGPTAPEWKPDISISDMLHVDVEYANPQDDTQIPDEWLAIVVSGLRKNFEHALRLETELGGYGLSNISPIIPSNVSNNDGYGRTHGLSGCVISFSSLFARLIELDIAAARQEFAAWPVNDDTIFSRLRIWASGNAELISASDFGLILANLSARAFWDGYHQRDLLLVLAKRWQELSDYSFDSLKEIEQRLLEGPPRWPDEEDAKFEKRCAWAVLNRITWLANNGCFFICNLAAETEKLRVREPEWQPGYAAKAADSLEGRGGFVKTETDHASLLDEPLKSILSKALELSGRTEDFLVEKAPFAGLSTERPVRAFAALTDAARKNEYPEWAWRTFLDSGARKTDKPKLSALIAERMCRYPDETVTEFLRPATDWLLNISEQLALRFPGTFDKAMSKLINVLRSYPPTGNSSIVRGSKEPDWTMEALNSPVGKLAQALLKDPRKDNLKAASGFPQEWITHVDALLSLDGDLHRHALVMFAHSLTWFYYFDPNWAETNLLSVLDGDNEDDRNAVWSGFFWGAKVPSPKLYIRMKPNLLAVAKKQRLSERGYCEVLSGIILAGWGSSSEENQERFISNDEMREVLLLADDEFRSQILWQLERWTKIHEDGTDEKWSAMLPELLRDVWPRQKSAKTPAITARLCDLAFSNAEHFPEIVEIILPLLTTAKLGHLMLPEMRKPSPNIVDRYPHQTLTLLHAVLPDTVVDWPYGIEAAFQRIGEADSSLKQDERWLELTRKWNAR